MSLPALPAGRNNTEKADGPMGGDGDLRRDVLNVVKNANGCRPSGMHQNAPPALSFSRASP